MTNHLITDDPMKSLDPAYLELLRRPLYGFVSTAAGPTPPQPRPVWFELTASGEIQFFTGPETVRVRRLRRDPRASIVVTAPLGEPERWVSIAGSVTMEADGASALLERLAARYWNLEDPTRADLLTEMLNDEWVRVVIHPDSVAKYTI